MLRKTVREHCERLGITIEELAARSDLEESRVRAIYQARWTPSPQERRRIATALDVELEEIGWGHEISPQPFYGHGPT